MAFNHFSSALQVAVLWTLLLNANGNPALTSEVDVLALQAVKEWISSVDILSAWTGDPCLDKWPGITCSSGESPLRVISIDLSNLGLMGQISSQIGDLERLEYLSLSNNELSGIIPPAIGRLSSLRNLYLDNNRFTGYVPIELGDLLNLKELCLSNNELWGELPKSFHNLQYLELLDIRHTRLQRSVEPSSTAGDPDETLSREERVLATESALEPALAPEISPVTSPPPPRKTSSRSPPPQRRRPPPPLTLEPPITLPTPSSSAPSAPAPAVSSLPPVISPSALSPIVDLVPPPAFSPLPSSPPPPPPKKKRPPPPPLEVPPAAIPVEPPVTSPSPSLSLPPPSKKKSPPPSKKRPPPPKRKSPPPVIAPAVAPAPSPASSPTSSPPEFAPSPAEAPMPIVPKPPPKSARRPPPSKKRTPAPPPSKKSPPPSKRGSPPPRRPPPATERRSPPPKKRSPPPRKRSPPPSPPLAPTPAPDPAPEPAPAPSPPPPARPPPPSSPPPPPSCPLCIGEGSYPRPLNCTCVFPLYAWFLLNLDFNVFKTLKAEKFRGQLAQNLPFPLEDIVFVNMVQGSVNLNVAFMPASPDTQLNDTTIGTALDVLRNTNGKSLLFTSDFGNVTVLNTTSPAILPATTLTPPPPGVRSELSLVAIIAIAAGGGAAIVIFVLILLWCCCCQGKKRPKPVPDAPKDYTPPKAGSTTLRTPAGWANGEPLELDYEDSPVGKGREVESGRLRDSSSPLISRREAREAPSSMTLSGASNYSQSPLPGGEQGGAMVATAAAVASLSRMESRKKKEEGAGGNGGQRKSLPVVGAQAFTVADLQMSTNSFSLDNRIGEGPLGVLYRADFAQGRALAIRKMDPALVEGMSEEDFKGIVSNMARLRHPNLVELHGYCVQYGQRLLAFQYFPGGSLYDYLRDPHLQQQAILSWDVRLRLAIGCARALEYIHEQVSPSVMHRNFKSSNILLDRELSPHVADCGMAVFNLAGMETMAQGGLSYVAPEYTTSGIYTEMSDVYSYGVVLLELLTGREPIDMSRAKPEQSLVRWAFPLLSDLDELEAMIDPNLPGPRPDKTSLTRFAEVITRCLQSEPELRPPMSKVVQDLIRRVTTKSPKSNGVDRSPADKQTNGGFQQN